MIECTECDGSGYVNDTCVACGNGTIEVECETCNGSGEIAEDAEESVATLPSAVPKTDVKIPLYVPRSKGYPDVTWLVFNCLPNEKEKAKHAFVRRYGATTFKQVIQPSLDEGIMSIFHNSPNEHTAFYVNKLGKLVDERTLVTQASKEA